MSFKVEIKENDFKKMVESVKHCVTKNTNRKVYEYIELSIINDQITAFACNGYMAAKTTVPAAMQNITDEFKCYIKPIKIKVSKTLLNKVVIELDNNIATVEIMTEYGKVKYCFEQYKIEAINLTKIYERAQKNIDRKIGVNPNFIKQAVTALSQIFDMPNKAVVFETQSNNKEPIIIKAEEGNCISEQLILPMRLN